MLFHENRLLAEDSHVISCLFFFWKLVKMSENLSSAAVVIGAWVNLIISSSEHDNSINVPLFMAHYFSCWKNLFWDKALVTEQGRDTFVIVQMAEKGPFYFMYIYRYPIMIILSPFPTTFFFPKCCLLFTSVAFIQVHKQMRLGADGKSRDWWEKG